MHISLRIILLLVIAPSVFFFIYWVPFSLIQIGENEFVRMTFSILSAVLTGWFILSATKSPSKNSLLSSIICWAFITGGVGFFAGFFGPIIFTPEANQGPLVGIIFTGPLGLLLGAIIGLIYWLRNKRANENV